MRIVATLATFEVVGDRPSKPAGAATPGGS
jgi:hypothetical protein